jgi:hypothetical protein
MKGLNMFKLGLLESTHGERWVTHRNAGTTKRVPLYIYGAGTVLDVSGDPISSSFMLPTTLGLELS